MAEVELTRDGLARALGALLMEVGTVAKDAGEIVETMDRFEIEKRREALADAWRGVDTFLQKQYVAAFVRDGGGQ
jgi:hypothetical protein